MDQTETKKLIVLARQAMENSYCPYSKFPVGCALLCKDGSIFTGCNVENSGYSGCVCAEKTAVVKAVSSGQREFKAIAVTTNLKDFASPCGNCRQFMSEFGTDLIVILAKENGEYQQHVLNDLLPFSFGPKDLFDYNKKININ